LEKRINSEQTILDFLDNASFTVEMPRRTSQEWQQGARRPDWAYPE
jgi:hypothetical protein